MLTPDWYEKCTADIIALYQQLEDDIIKDIVKKMLKTNKVTEKEKWQVEMLQEAGTLYSDIVQMVAAYTNQAADEVRKIFEEAAVELMEADNKIAERAGREPLALSDSKLQTLSAMYQATMGNLQNLTNTTAATSQTAFISACNAAEMQVANGTLSYHDAIWNAIKQFAIGATVTYPSGHQDRIDVAISRAVRTGVGQAAAEISKANAEELGTDLMEITAHSGARPSHAAWQGKLVSLSGENAGEVVAGVRVLSLDEIGYGTGDGFRGWNCRHDWFPFFAEISELNYTEEQLKKLDEKHIELDGKLYTDYEVSQMQRKAERKIRALKRELVCYDAAGDKDGFSACSVKLKTAEQQLKDFLKETERDRESWREKVNKFDENSDSKRISDFKKELTFGGKSDIIDTDKSLKIDVQFFANKKIPKMKSTELLKSIKSWNREIAEHQDKIANPGKHYPLWDDFDVRQQNGYKKHWEKEIRTMQADVEQAIEELKKRGEYNE